MCFSLVHRQVSLPHRVKLALVLIVLNGADNLENYPLLFNIRISKHWFSLEKLCNLFILVNLRFLNWLRLGNNWWLLSWSFTSTTRSAWSWNSFFLIFIRIFHLFVHFNKALLLVMFLEDCLIKHAQSDINVIHFNCFRESKFSMCCSQTNDWLKSTNCDRLRNFVLVVVRSLLADCCIRFRSVHESIVGQFWRFLRLNEWNEFFQEITGY